MAVTKTVLKASEAEAIVKVEGTAAAATITLDTDLLAASQVATSGDQTVYITGLTWTGANNGIVTITRNAKTIATLQANAAGYLDFAGQAMTPDTVESTSDVVVTISGAQAECWLRLKKVDGYRSKVEYGRYGSYDDTTAIGAVDLNNGSPGYTPE